MLDEIGLGQRDHPAPQAQQRANVQMLTSLRLHALIGGHHEQQSHHQQRGADERVDGGQQIQHMATDRRSHVALEVFFRLVFREFL